jgi:hypothetical protein
MFETLLAAGLLAKIKRYKIKYLFTTWTIYPALFVQAVLIYFEISAICGNYYFTRFAKEIQISVILSYIFPMLAFQLYKPALVGCALTTAGSMLNHFVIAQNGGSMPVFPGISYVTQYIRPHVFSGDVAGIHTLGNAAVKYWYLTDFIDLGYTVLSLGDILIHLNTLIMLYYTIKAVNMRQTAKQLQGIEIN